MIAWGEAGDTEAASSALEDCKHIRSSVQISAPIALEVKAFLCIYSVSVLNLQGLRKDKNKNNSFFISSLKGLRMRVFTHTVIVFKDLSNYKICPRVSRH